MIQHLFGLRSLRQTVQEMEVNVAYRWFLGYTLNEELPHFSTVSYNFSTVSYNFKHRYTAETVEAVFAWILDEANGAGYLSRDPRTYSC